MINIVCHKNQFLKKHYFFMICDINNEFQLSRFCQSSLGKERIEVFNAYQIKS